jgi:NYN domain/OST-HTH/LOTUS domain
MLQVAHTSGKNSTDSALIIDAMDLLYSGNVDAFALVSSDSDFTSLATRLRASGKTVYGLGLRKTPESLRRAVDRFIFLEDLDDASTDGHREESADPESPESPSARRVPDLRRLLERAITSTAHDDGWASLSSVANHVIRVEPSFSVKDYDASKLVDLVRAQSYVDVDQPESGPVRVRLAVKEPAKKATTARTSGRKAAATKAAPEPAAAEPAAPVEAPEKPAAKKVAKKTVTTRTRKRTTTSSQSAAVEPVPEQEAQPAPEPVVEASPEPAGKPQVTTRKRSSRSAQPL